MGNPEINTTIQPLELQSEDVYLRELMIQLESSMQKHSQGLDIADSVNWAAIFSARPQKNLKRAYKILQAYNKKYFFGTLSDEPLTRFEEAFVINYQQFVDALGESAKPVKPLVEYCQKNSTPTPKPTLKTPEVIYLRQERDILERVRSRLQQFIQQSEEALTISQAPKYKAMVEGDIKKYKQLLRNLTQSSSQKIWETINQRPPLSI